MVAPSPSRLRLRFLAISTILTSIFTSASTFAIPAARAADGPNSLCSKNGVASLSFSGVRAIPIDGDVCAIPDGSVPDRVRGLLAEIGRVHRSVARTIGQSWSETFVPGVSIFVLGNGAGSLGSSTARDGSSITVSVFPDAELSSWPRVSYAHELTHFLLYRKGAFSSAGVGLIDHPFFTEALPDLVALESNGTEVMPIEDDGLPAGLRVARDARPVRSLDDPFGEYFLYAPSRDLSTRCSSVAEKNDHARAVCALADPDGESAFYSSMPGFDSDLAEPTSAELAAPFEPSRCLYRMRGWNVLGACNTHRFALPLVSFFSALRKATGRSWVSEWIRILKAEAPTAERFECEYRSGIGEPAEIALRGISPSLRALRESLPAESRSRFDEDWTAHGLSKLAELDSLYLNETRETESLLPLLVKNPRYGHGCGSPFTLDPKACSIVCRPIGD